MICATQGFICKVSNDSESSTGDNFDEEESGIQILKKNACPINRINFTEEIGYIVFPFKKGMDLTSMIQTFSFFAVNNPIVWLKLVLNISLHLHKSLQKMHALRVFHLDIKPANIYLENFTRETDFGNLKPADRELQNIFTLFLDLGLSCSAPFNRKNIKDTRCDTRFLNVGTPGFRDLKLLDSLKTNNMELNDLIKNNMLELKNAKLYNIFRLMDLFALGVTINCLFRGKDDDFPETGDEKDFPELPRFFDEDNLVNLGYNLNKMQMKTIELFFRNSIGIFSFFISFFSIHSK